jgi:hypothetical protein
LRDHAAAAVRIEVPFTRSHWEAAWLAPHVELARGWERQLDKRYDEELESSSLTAAGYRRWLDHDGVSYVALPDVPFDQSSDAEVRLIRGGLPYLREQLHTAHWRVFKVLGASPIVTSLGADGWSGGMAGWLTALGIDSFRLRLPAAGRYLVKVHYTPYWTVTGGTGAVGQGPGGFTEVRVARAGALTVATRFSLAAVGRSLAAAL